VRTYTTDHPPPTREPDASDNNPLTHTHPPIYACTPKVWLACPCSSYEPTCTLVFSHLFDFFCFPPKHKHFPGTFRRCPKAKSRAKSYAHASADSFCLLFFFSRRLFVAGHPILYDSGFSFFSCEPLSLFVHFLHCIAMVTLGRILFDMVPFQRDHETRGHEQ
jgi:hypothetical protein